MKYEFYIYISFTRRKIEYPFNVDMGIIFKINFTCNLLFSSRLHVVSFILYNISIFKIREILFINAWYSFPFKLFDGTICVWTRYQSEEKETEINGKIMDILLIEKFKARNAKYIRL